MADITFEGGINEQDATLVSPSECVSGYNFELGFVDTHFKPRKAFDLMGTSTNAADIRGFVQLVTSAGVETTLVQSGDTVYEWDGASTFTSRGTVNSNSQLRFSQWTLDGYCVITDLQKQTVVKKWNGTALTTLTTGLGSDLYAKYSVVHDDRLWLFNVKAVTDTPHVILASVFENPESYDTTTRVQDSGFSTGQEAFFITIPDGKAINGVAKFYDTLVISTEDGRLWKLTGSDSTDYAIIPFYSGSAATGTETLVNTGNDVFYMRTGGTIESLSTSDAYGDVSADDISRWIRNTVDGLTDAIGVYDQTRQKVYFFAGSNKLLVFFKNMVGTDLSPWSLYKTDHSSSFDTNAAIYMRSPGSTNYFVFFGDSSGNIYKLDGDSQGDPSSTTITTYRRSKYFDDIQGLNSNFDRLRGRVNYRRVSDVDLLIDFEWGDDYAINRCTVPLEGPPIGDGANYFNASAYFGGEFYFNEGFFYAERVSTKGLSPVGRGPGFIMELTITSTLQFDVMKIVI